MRLLAGTEGKEIAERVAHILNVKLGQVDIRQSDDGELHLNIIDDIRNKDVFILQPTVTNPNNSLMELLILVDACKRGSAARIIAVIPSFGYCRQDKKEKSSTPVTTKLVANLLEVAGVNRILTVDLHSSQIQGFFNIPVDNLLPDLYMLRFLRTIIWKELGMSDPHEAYLEAALEGAPSPVLNRPSIKDSVVVISPGVSNAERAQKYASSLHASAATIHFGQLVPGGVKSEIVAMTQNMHVVGKIEGKIAILVQDLADTCTVLSLMSDQLLAQGAKKVYVVVTHGVLSENGVERLNKSSIHRLIMSNTVPLKQTSEKIVLINIAPLLAEAIRRIHNGESVAYLFSHVPDTEVHLSVQPFVNNYGKVEDDDLDSPRQHAPEENST